MAASFPAAVIESFDKTNTVEIETKSAKGTKHSVPIWIVVADGVPYVRSVRGPQGRWYKELLARGEGAIVARGKRTPVKAIHDRSKTAIEVALDELRKITVGQIADDDIALAKDKLVGELDVALESPAGVASMVLEAEMFELGEDHFERYPRELRAVTKDQVIDTARTFLPPDRYALAVAGPALPEALV